MLCGDLRRNGKAKAMYRLSLFLWDFLPQPQMRAILPAPQMRDKKGESLKSTKVKKGERFKVQINRYNKNNFTTTGS